MTRFYAKIEAAGAILLALIWISPLVYAFWAAFHSTSDAVNFNLFSPWTLENFRVAWDGAPWIRYFLNTFMLVTVVLIGQFILTTLAGFSFAKLDFPGKDFVFILVLMQLFILPEVLIVENYAMVSRLGLFDSILGVGMPYMASAFGIFLMRQSFKSVPIELHEAAQVEGCGIFGILWKVYVPLARPTYIAYALVSVSTHWNNFLWPLIVTNSPDTRPLTVGLSIFAAPENGVDISIISAATMMSVAPLLVAFFVVSKTLCASISPCRYQMTNVIHISDTHIVPDGYLVADRLNTVQQLHKLVKYLIEHAPEYGPIDAIILSGDVSDDGSLESYSCFKEIMQSLNVPVYVVPGNHDLRENMRKSFLDEGYIPKEGRLNWHRNIGDIQLIGLDSLKEGFGEGELDSDTLFFLRTTLDRVDNAPVILMLHHPPFKSGIKFMDKIGLKTGLDEFKNIVKTYPGSMRIVCGHIHSIMVSTVENKTVISAPSPASSFLFNVQDDAPAGFMDIGEGCFIHRWEEGFQSIKLSNSLSNGPFPF